MSTATEVRATNQRRIFRIVMGAALVGLALDVIVVIIAAIRGDAPAITGALIGTALALVITLPTVVSVRLGARLEPHLAAAVLAGAWLAKMLVVVVVLALLRDVSSISLPWVGIALLAGALASAIAEAIGLTRRRPRLEVDEAPSESA